MKKLNHLFLMLLAMTFFACEDDTEDAVVDTEDPSISLSAPTGEMEIFADEQVHVSADVSDNLGLEAVTISVTPPDGEPQVVHTEEVRTFLNDEKNAEVDEDISLSTGTAAPGDYTITVRAVDIRGNDASQSVTVTVVEADDEGPAIADITSPSEGAEFVRGDDVTITSSVSDNRELGEVRVMVTSGDTEIFSQTYDAEDFDDDLTSFEINDEFTIEEGDPIGNYVLTIEADDARGNAAEAKTVNFTVAQTAGEE